MITHRQRKRQGEVVERVVRWYFATHFGRDDDPGLPAMFCDRRRLGSFAVSPAALGRGESGALFQVLISTIMFQRRQDVQIARILRDMAPVVGREIRSSKRLLALVDSSPCAILATTDGLHQECDLAKDEFGRGVCGAKPTVECHLKRHTVALKRYGHFGKFPTSAALVLREAGVADLGQLRQRVLAGETDPRRRAVRLEGELSRIWRVNQKIASMFLATVCNPEIGAAPWRRGVDWTYFVVVDSNVDLFLDSIGYRGGKSYDSRREFVTQLARDVDLCRYSRRVKVSFNPRLVQQAMYLFMSASNRRAMPRDCMHLGQAACASCPKTLRDRCPVRIR